MTQGISVRVPLPQFVHPVGCGPWSTSTLHGKADHRVGTPRPLFSWGRHASLLNVEPDQQPGSKLLVDVGDALEG